jgi:hypothetical protein
MTPNSPPPLDLPPILARAAQLAEARAKATPGPWEHGHTGHLSNWFVTTLTDHPRFKGTDIAVSAGTSNSDDDGNARFIATARNLTIEDDVRALAAECERLKAENERLREIEATARNFIRCTTDPGLSPYVRENGRHGKSPWAELIEAVNATQGPQGGPP